MVNGRGAWSVSGLGGTLGALGDKPGPYYVLNASGCPRVGSGGWAAPDPNERAVHGGVRAIQNALRRRLHLSKDDLPTTGRFNVPTSQAVIAFQKQHEDKVGVADGILGPKTARALFVPDVVNLVGKGTSLFPWEIVAGVLNHESSFDPGAVGYADPTDLGLAQINGPSHPQMSDADRLAPMVAIQFVIDFLNGSLNQFHVSDVAIASYNLGRGGAAAWARASMPCTWTPPKMTKARHVGGPNCSHSKKDGYVDQVKGFTF